MGIIKRIIKNILPYYVVTKYQAYKKENILPKKVRLEASTICQLKCKSCSFQRNDCGTLGKGYLSFTNFKSFLEKNKFIKVIELSNFGEIFLNPDIIHIIKYSYENNVSLLAENGVNFNTVTNEVIEAIVKYQFKSILISIDGASQSIYSMYRVNGNFDKVIDNIKMLNEYKQIFNSKYPELIWQFVLIEHNENDVINAKKKANELGMRISFKLTWDKGYIPKNVEMLKKETGLKYLSREEVLSNEGKPYGNYGFCRLLWNEPQINWDGRLLGCCCVSNNDFGVNVFQIGLKKAINSKKYMQAKKMLLGKAGIPEDTKNIPCVNCNQYKTMNRTGKYIEL
jgi:MoaA/NifB/PqqE/SkfB family radical SAM enzyme